MPQPDTVAALTDTGSRPSESNVETGDSALARVVTVYTLHYPFEEKECMSCHNENSPGEMVLPEPDLCYMCHDDFANQYEVVHGAVVLGMCTSCHQAREHRKKGYRSSWRVSGSVPCSSRYSCLPEHRCSCKEGKNGHQSRYNYLLKMTDQTLCTQCHDLEQVLQNEMHSDIGDTECTLCHNPHGGSDQYLIR